MALVEIDLSQNQKNLDKKRLLRQWKIFYAVTMKYFKKIIILFLFYAIIIVFYSQCSIASPTTTTCNVLGTEGDAKFRLTFTPMWNATSHPNASPGTAGHFSTFFGVAHVLGLTIFKLDEVITTVGVQQVVEGGGTNALQKEISKKVTANEAKGFFETPGIKNAQLSNQKCFEFWATTTYPYFSLISTVGPSPDWFIGLSAIALRENNAWKYDSAVSIKARVYDAGTEKGNTFNRSNAQEVPLLPVSLEDQKFNSLPVGIFMIQRIEVKTQ